MASLPRIDFIDDQAGKPVGIHNFIGPRSTKRRAAAGRSSAWRTTGKRSTRRA